MGFLAHLDAKNAFPNGGYGIVGVVRTWSANGQPEDYEQQNWSWGYQILPYIDQMPLWLNTSDTFVAETPVCSISAPRGDAPSP